MWTTLSFLDRERHAVCGTALAIFAGMLAVAAFGDERQATTPQIAPDSPRPARTRQAGEGRGEGPGETHVRPSVELKSVIVRRMDEKRAKLAGPEFAKSAEEPYYIEVQTQTSLGNLAQSSLPVILLNGENLLNTRALGDRTLVAFLPNLKMLKDLNTVGVVWLGDKKTMSKRPLTFERKDVVR